MGVQDRPIPSEDDDDDELDGMAPESSTSSNAQKAMQRHMKRGQDQAEVELRS